MTKTLLAVLLILYCFTANSQNQFPQKTENGNSSTYTYIYDYSNFDPTQDKDPTLKHNKDRVLVIVNNINRLIFDVNVTGTNRSIVLESTSIFDSLNKSLSKATTTSGGGNPISFVQLNSSRMLSSDSVAMRQKQTDIDLKIGEIKNKQVQINRMLVQLKAFSSFSVNVPIIIYGEKYSQNKIQARILETANLLNLKSGLNIANFNELSSIVNSKPIEYTNTIVADTMIISNDISSLNNLITELKTVCSSCDVTNANDFLKTVDYSTVRTVSSDSVIKAVTIVNNLFNKINDANNFKYISPEFKPDGDELDIALLIQPKDQYKDSYSSDSISKKLNIKGKFEWSIGPALNFSLSKSLFDMSYNIDSARTSVGVLRNDTFTIKQNRTKGSGVPSIGVMANFYWQQHTSLNAGITVGLSTSATDLSQIRAYLGGCLLIGGLTTDANKNLAFNCIRINAGISYGQVDRLKGNLNIGDNPKSQIPYTGNNIATDQLTEKVGHFGFFVGFSYKIN